uniref:Uncharacterized protein n=1 Tax=Glossina austeni TaxID=7395 RepID=A0A1A9VWM1_GLOAU
MTRTRKILQSPQNGGKHCPTLMQKRGCQGYRCHGHHDKKILRETALLLPAALSYSRHANDSHDIRRNLRLRYHDSYKHNRELDSSSQAAIQTPKNINAAVLEDRCLLENFSSGNAVCSCSHPQLMLLYYRFPSTL